jgi:hypothetical protein
MEDYGGVSMPVNAKKQSLESFAGNSLSDRRIKNPVDGGNTGEPDASLQAVP